MIKKFTFFFIFICITNPSFSDIGVSTPTTIFSVSEDDVSPIFLPSNIGFAGDGVTGSTTSNGILLTIPGGGSGSGAPTDAQYVVLSTDGDLSDERVLTAGTYIDLTDAGAGSTITVAVDSTEVEAVTWGAGGNASNLWTFSVSGTNVTVTWGNATATIVGVVVSDGFTLGANENLTLGAETLDHDGTNFVFSDSVFINGSDNEIQHIVEGNATQTTNIWVVRESDTTEIISADDATVKVNKNFDAASQVQFSNLANASLLQSDGAGIVSAKTSGVVSGIRKTLKFTLLDPKK